MNSWYPFNFKLCHLIVFKMEIYKKNMSFLCQLAELVFFSLLSHKCVSLHPQAVCFNLLYFHSQSLLKSTHSQLLISPSPIPIKTRKLFLEFLGSGKVCLVQKSLFFLFVSRVFFIILISCFMCYCTCLLAFISSVQFSLCDTTLLSLTFQLCFLATHTNMHSCG